MTNFVAYALEVDNEGVHGDANGDNEPGHAGEGQAIAHGPAQQGDDQIGAHGGDDQGCHCDHGQPAVLPGQEHNDEQEADQPGINLFKSFVIIFYL